MISEDIDCNNCKIRRNYDSFLKEIISKLTFNQHDLHYEKDKRNIINDYTVRFYFTCVHPECESKFFLLINLIKNKASLFSNINNGLMSHHLNSSLNTKKIEDHDYCKIILQKTKAKRQHYSVWSDFKKVFEFGLIFIQIKVN
jgi:hypothetical protein